MKLIEYIRAANQLEQTPSYASMVHNPEAAETGVAPPDDIGTYQSLYSAHTDIYRAVSVKTNSIAQLPVKIYRRKDGMLEDITDKPDFDIFRRYNDHQTHYEFWESVIGYLEMTGESPWLIEYTGNTITQMFPLRSDRIKIHPHNEFLVSYYSYHHRGKEVKIPPENIFFLKYFNPENHLRGLSPIAAAKGEITLDLHALTAGKKTFELGARPSGVLSPTEMLSDTEHKRVVEAIRSSYQGASNFGKIMALNMGMKWQQLQYTNEELQYMDIRGNTSKQIAKVFGVPPIFFMDFKDASVLANADVQYKLLWHTLIPMLRKLEGIFTELLLPMITSEQNVVFRFDTSDVAALKPDQKLLAGIYLQGIESGAVTPNEMRVDVYGKDPVDDPSMDSHRLPIVSETEEESPLKRFQSTVKELLAANPESVSEQVTKSVGKIKQRIAKAELTSLTYKTWSEIEEISERNAKPFIKKLKKIFSDIEAEVLDNLSKLRWADEIIHKGGEGALYDIDKAAAEFEAAGQPHIAAALQEAGELLAGSLGTEFDVTDPFAASYVNEEARAYATIVNQTTVDQIDGIVKAGLDAGAEISAISESIEQYFTNNAAMRSERIARTEMVRSSNKGRIAAMKQGKVEYHMWISQRDSKVRDGHFNNDGTVVKVGEDFPTADDTMGDPTFPSSINERCFTIPVEKPKE